MLLAATDDQSIRRIWRMRDVAANDDWRRFLASAPQAPARRRLEGYEPSLHDTDKADAARTRGTLEPMQRLSGVVAAATAKLQPRRPSSATAGWVDFIYDDGL